MREGRFLGYLGNDCACQKKKGGWAFATSKVSTKLYWRNKHGEYGKIQTLSLVGFTKEGIIIR